MTAVVHSTSQRHVGSRDSLRLAPLRQPAAQSIPIDLCMVGINRPLAQLLVGLDDTLHDLRQVIYTQVSAQKLPPRFAFTNVDGAVVLARLEATKFVADFAPRVSVVPKTVRGGLPESGRIAAIRRARAVVAAALEDSDDTKMATTINPPMRTAWEPTPSDRLRRKSLSTWLKGSQRKASSTRRTSHFAGHLVLSSSFSAAASNESSHVDAAVLQELCLILDEYASKAAVELQRLQRGRVGRRVAAQRNKNHDIGRRRVNLGKTRQATRGSMACRLTGKRVRLGSNVETKSVAKQSQEKSASSARANSCIYTHNERNERLLNLQWQDDTVVQQEVRGWVKAGLAPREGKHSDPNIGHVAVNHSLSLKPAAAEAFRNVSRDPDHASENSSQNALPSRYEDSFMSRNYSGGNELPFEDMSHVQYPGNNSRSDVTSQTMTKQLTLVKTGSRENLFAARSRSPDGQVCSTITNLPETAKQIVAHTTPQTELARYQMQLPAKGDRPPNVERSAKSVAAAMSRTPTRCANTKDSDVRENGSQREQGSCGDAGIHCAREQSVAAKMHNGDAYPERDVECDTPPHRVRRGSDVPSIDVVRRAGKRLLKRGVMISGFKSLCMIFLSSVTSAGFEVEVLLMDHNSKLLTAEISLDDLKRIREGLHVPSEAKDEVLAEAVLSTLEIQRATSSTYELVAKLPLLLRHGSANSIDSRDVSDNVTPATLDCAADENLVELGDLNKLPPNVSAHEVDTCYDSDTLREGFAQQLTIQNRPYIGSLFASEQFRTLKLNVYDPLCDETANIRLCSEDLTPLCAGGAVNIRTLGYVVFAALSSMSEVDFSRTDRLHEALVRAIACHVASPIAGNHQLNDTNDSFFLEAAEEAVSSLSTREAQDLPNEADDCPTGEESRVAKFLPRLIPDESHTSGGRAVTIQHYRCLMSLTWIEGTDSLDFQIHNPSTAAVAEVRLTKADLDSLELPMEDVEQVGTIFANASEKLADLENFTTPDIHGKLMQILSSQKFAHSGHHAPATSHRSVRVEAEVFGKAEQVRQATAPILLHTNAVLLRNKRHLAKVFEVGNDLLIRAYHPSLPASATEINVTENDWTSFSGFGSLRQLNEEQKTMLCRRLLTLLRLSNPPNEMVYLNTNNKARRLSRKRRDQIVNLTRSTKLGRISGSEHRMSEYARGVVISGQHVLLRLALQRDFSCHIEGLIMHNSSTVRTKVSRAEMTAMCDVERCELKEIFETVTAELVLKECNKGRSLDLRSRAFKSSGGPQVSMPYEQEGPLHQMEAGNDQDAPADVSPSPASVLQVAVTEQGPAARNTLGNFETWIDGWCCMCALFDAGSECIVEARRLTKLDRKLSIRISRSKIPTFGDTVEEAARAAALSQFISSRLEIRCQGGSEQLAWKESHDVLSDKKATMWTRGEPAPAVGPMIFEAVPEVVQFRQEIPDALEGELVSGHVPQWHEKIDCAVAIESGSASADDVSANPMPSRAVVQPVKAEFVDDFPSRDKRTRKIVFEGIAAPLTSTTSELDDATAMTGEGAESKDSLEVLEDITAKGHLSTALSASNIETEMASCKSVSYIGSSARHRREGEPNMIHDAMMESDGTSVPKDGQCTEAATIKSILKPSANLLPSAKSTSAIAEEVEKINGHVEKKKTFTLSTCHDIDHPAQEHSQRQSENRLGPFIPQHVDLVHCANEMVTRVLKAVLRRVEHDTIDDANHDVPMLLVEKDMRLVDRLHAITSDDVQEVALTETEKAQLGLAFKSEQTPNEFRKISESLLASLFRLQSHIRFMKTDEQVETSIAALAEVQEPDRQTLSVSTATTLLKWKLKPEQVVIEAYTETGSKSELELEASAWAHTGFRNVEQSSNDTKLDFIATLLTSLHLGPSLTDNRVPPVLRTGESHAPGDWIQMGFRLTSSDSTPTHTYLLLRILRIDSTVMRVFVLDTSKGKAWTQIVDLAQM